MALRIPDFVWHLFIVVVVVELVALSVESNDNQRKNGRKDTRDELVCAHVVYRHGNRSIVIPVPNDPYKSEKFWPDGYGQLTNSGKHYQYLLGQYFRKRYRKLIGIYYSRDNVYIQSSNVDRCLQSALCNAYGLFPAHGRQVWKYGTNWQPVPIHAPPPDKQDLLQPPIIKCAKLTKSFVEYMTSDEIHSKLEGIPKFRKYLERHSGTNCDELFGFAQIYDSLRVESLRGLPLPKWAKSVWENEQSRATLEYFAALFLKGFAHDLDTKRISAGFLLKEIFDRFQLHRTTANYIPKQKLFLYSAHDATIVCLLSALNIFDNDVHMPPFSSSLHFELYMRADGEYYVQLFYRRDSSDYLPPIEIPNCGTKCSLNRFIELYADALPRKNDTYGSLCKL